MGLGREFLMLSAFSPGLRKKARLNIQGSEAALCPLQLARPDAVLYKKAAAGMDSLTGPRGTHPIKSHDILPCSMHAITHGVTQ